MSLQKTFRARYAQQLEDEAKQGIGIERYTKSEFDYDKEQIFNWSFMKFIFYIQLD